MQAAPTQPPANAGLAPSRDRSAVRSSQPPPAAPERLGADRALLLSIFVIGCLVVILRNAWLCDDAYITMRTVRHFVDGFGLRYNIAERVQTYTHPLWMFLLSFFYFLTREAYYTVLAVGVVASVTAVSLVAFKLARSLQSAILGLVILLCSKAFMDYATSGMETSLSFLLLALFSMAAYRETQRPPLFLVSFLGSLCVLNRMDTALIVFPWLACLFWRSRGIRAVLVMTLGFFPFILWEAFSVLYYGFPVPNTAYAKLATGISQNDLFVQGFYYWLSSITLDPVTMLAIAGALALPFAQKRWESLPLAVGLALYLFYVTKIGGGFMTGRFFALPLFGAVIILSRAKLSIPSSLAAGVLLLTLGLASPRSPIVSGVNYAANVVENNGITDERGFWYRMTGLLGAGRFRANPSSPGERRSEGPPVRKVTVQHAIGQYGYSASRYEHVLDRFALADPLLARLPAIRTNWRIGHFARNMPEGYLDTLLTGENQIRDKPLAEYYEKLALIVRGRLFEPGRCAAIVEMNLGRCNDLIDRKYYRREMARRVLSIVEVSVPKTQGAAWNAPGTIVLSQGGAAIVHIGELTNARTVEVSADGNDVYDIAFFRGQQKLGAIRIEPNPAASGLSLSRLDVPPEAATGGYNRIEVTPSGGDGLYSIGHLILHP